MGEQGYLKLLSKIVRFGNTRPDRTETGTLSLFGEQLRFDIRDSIPLLTTKRVPFRIIVEELLWFLRGDTHNNVLKEKNIHIWDGNTSREFLDSRGLIDYEEGVLGKGYGWQIRHQGAPYDQKYADTRNVDRSLIGGFDQLEYIVNLLKTDPFSRRIMMSYWNPSDFGETSLVPCHISCQFYVEEIEGKRYLSSHLYQRSNDVFLGTPFNICSYSILTYILAKNCDMIPKDFILSMGDVHIYSTHMEQVKTQLSRDPKPFPQLVVHDSIQDKDWHDMTVNDFTLVDYASHPPIQAPMAV